MSLTFAYLSANTYKELSHISIDINCYTHCVLCESEHPIFWHENWSDQVVTVRYSFLNNVIIACTGTITLSKEYGVRNDSRPISHTLLPLPSPIQYTYRRSFRTARPSNTASPIECTHPQSACKHVRKLHFAVNEHASCIHI